MEKYVDIYEVTTANSASMMLSISGLINKMIARIAPEDEDV